MGCGWCIVHAAARGSGGGRGAVPPSRADEARIGVDGEGAAGTPIWRLVADELPPLETSVRAILEELP